jgi:hypothetical protein
MIAPDISIQNSLPDTSCGNRVAGRPACCAAEEATFIPYHAEDESSVLCWDCHGYIVGPPGRRLCHCQQELEVVSPAEAEKLRALAALRDALAETYRRRWFRVLMPLLDDAEDEARVAWDGLWNAARERAARRLAKRGLR